MEKYSIDFNVLDKEINAPKRIKLADVKDRIEKVGFGVVRFTDEKNKTNLWQVVDGEYIVAMYDDPTDQQNKEGVAWSVESDKLNKSATIFYKNTPIKSVAFFELGVKDDEIKSFKEVLPERLATNKNLVKLMIDSVDQKYRTELFTKYPELKY